MDEGIDKERVVLPTDNFSPVEHALLLGSSVEIDGETINKDYLIRLKREGKALPAKLLMPISLQGTPDKQKIAAVIANREGRHKLDSTYLLSENSMEAFRTRRKDIYFEAAWIDEEGKPLPIWKMHTVNSRTGQLEDEPELLENLEFSDEVKDIVVMVEHPEGGYALALDSVLRYGKQTVG